MSAFTSLFQKGNQTTVRNRIAVRAYLWCAWLFMILIPVQFYFAAAGSFSNLGFSPHIWLGLSLHGISALLIAIALVGRLPRRALYWGVLQFVLISIQVGLARLKFPTASLPIEPNFVRDLSAAIMQPIHDTMASSAGMVASLHGLNAFAIAAVAVLTVRFAIRIDSVRVSETIATQPEVESPVLVSGT